AFCFAILVPLMELCRSFAFDRWPRSWAEVPFEFDAYVAGAFLLAGAIADRRRLVIAGWGFWLGILYRSFFQHFADPSRQAGTEILLLATKAVLLASALAGLVCALCAKKTAA